MDLESSVDTLSSLQRVPRIATPPQEELQRFSGAINPYFVAIDPLDSSIPRYKQETLIPYSNGNIGSGSYGYCHKVFSPIIGVTVMKLDHGPTLPVHGGTHISMANLERFRKRRREFESIYRLNHHPNIVSFYGYIVKEEQTEPIGILMEYMAGGDIYKYITQFHLSNQEHYHLPEIYQNTWMKHIALGLNFMHSRDIMHRDLKPNNILLSHDLRVAKIADFGLSKNFANDLDEHTYNIGNILYCAPEIYMNEPYTKAVDIYAYAMVLYFIFYKKDPFDINQLKKFSVYMRANLIKGDENNQPLRPPLSNMAVDPVIIQCWKSNPDDRMKMSDLVVFLFNEYEGQRLYPALDI